jgi:N6-L-threonylcarbamoyladenine synthase
VIDGLAKTGDPSAFRFPMPSLHKTDSQGSDHRYDLSYSGLKTAVINQLEQFRVKPAVSGNEAAVPDARAAISETEAANIAASFQKTAVEILLRSLFRAAEDTGLTTIVAGGGVAANSYLRARLAERRDLRCIFPPLELCGDNGAMVAGLACQCLERGDRSPLSVTASARVKAFKRRYP